jgi:predicted enzyme related to lactoylglutathione lyase
MLEKRIRDDVNHTIVFFEIPADDVAKMKDFYKAVFDWKVIDIPGQDMEYTIFHTVPTDENGMLKEPGVNGGLYKRKDPSQVPINYIQVESIEDYLDKAVRNGGMVLMAKMMVPGMGFVAWIADPEGNPLGLIQPTQK